MKRNELIEILENRARAALSIFFQLIADPAHREWLSSDQNTRIQKNHQDWCVWFADEYIQRVKSNDTVGIHNAIINMRMNASSAACLIDGDQTYDYNKLKYTKRTGSCVFRDMAEYPRIIDYSQKIAQSLDHDEIEKINKDFQKIIKNSNGTSFKDSVRKYMDLSYLEQQDVKDLNILNNEIQRISNNFDLESIQIHGLRNGNIKDKFNHLQLCEDQLKYLSKRLGGPSEKMGLGKRIQLIICPIDDKSILCDTTDIFVIEKLGISKIFISNTNKIDPEDIWSNYLMARDNFILLQSQGQIVKQLTLEIQNQFDISDLMNDEINSAKNRMIVRK